MKSEIWRLASVVIVTVGLIVACFLVNGRYFIIHTEGDVVAKLDRYTGAISMCYTVEGTEGYTCSRPVH